MNDTANRARSRQASRRPRTVIQGLLGLLIMLAMVVPGVAHAQSASADWTQVDLGAAVGRLFTPRSGAFFARVGAGLMRSDDAGVTWAPVSLPDASRILAIDPTQPPGAVRRRTGRRLPEPRRRRHLEPHPRVRPNGGLRRAVDGREPCRSQPALSGVRREDARLWRLLVPPQQGWRHDLGADRRASLQSLRLHLQPPAGAPDRPQSGLRVVWLSCWPNLFRGSHPQQRSRQDLGHLVLVVARRQVARSIRRHR